MLQLAKEFLRIFAGNEIAHGEYKIDGAKGNKATGKAKTVKTPVTLDLWLGHLSGELGLGVVPITQKSTCTWGAVDIDCYEGMDLEALSMKLPEPLVLCRSKSGGAHIMLFTQQPVTATVMRKKLSLVARAVGHANAEIFPKQDTLNPNDIGNWINMPYFNAESTTRYCVKGGVALTAEEFVGYVAERAITIEQLVALNVPSILDANDDDPEFADGPPCLQYLVKHGFPPGTRNSGLFSMGVFARKKYASGWEDKVFEYNNRFMGPGTYTEVAGIIRSLNKKTYMYKCKDQPCLSACDKDKCAAAPYGVSVSTNEEKSTRPCILDEVDRPVTCYAPDKDSRDEPYWVFTINGQDLEVTVDMIRSQTHFAREYLRQYHRVVLPIKDHKWVTAMNDILAEAEIFELAPDAGPEGQFWTHMEDFCSSKAKAKSKDELLIGKPWEDEGRVFFRSGDLLKFLDQQRFRSMKETEILRALKRRDARHHSFTIKGKRVACWSVTAFSVQVEGFASDAVPHDVEF